jgi:phage shock protein PspC (stress-responsive transcriptional regulator)
VWGSLAQYLNLDAMLIRVLFVVLAVLGGSGLVL